MTGTDQAQLRKYYDSEYHYGEDVEKPNLDRLRRSMGHLGELRGRRFLDLGCGVGWATHIASEEGASYSVGLDFAGTALVRARRHTATAGWVQGDGTALPFADACFDDVFSFGSMEHFPDVQRGFAEAARVLRAGGTLLTVVPNWWVRTDQPQELRASERRWRTIAANAGFDVVRVASDHGPAILKNRRPLRVLMRIVLHIVSRIPGLRYQHVLVLRKRA
ncbi:MAG: class I SAM-dependent methyltransferase [Gemmatimonadaceae bacterium]|nr:class I SAM-dependent methyltransferase [Gemmatimonadaceae bacterium]NUR19936.1 class I SAM-dependent methyltransferase [Gemmatimonadaceae bacterium]NUS96639.1 class I SAM-dependent methyltransferase [Gemmatimonadaceae bacterium]